MDTGLFVLRVIFGLLLVGHGTQKLFGWFGGHGLEGTGGFFHSLGFRPGKVMATLAGASEVAGGLLLALGLLAPLAGAIVVGTLLVAASVHVEKGLWGSNGGYESALLYAVVAAAVALSGPGAASLDNLFGLDDHWSVGLGAAAIVVGLLSGTAVIGRAHRALRQDATATTSGAEHDRTAATAA